MRYPLHALRSGALALGATVLASSFTPAQAGLERRPGLAFPELDQPPSPSCAAPCAGARLDQPGAGGQTANAGGSGALEGGSVDGSGPGGEDAGDGGDGSSGGVDSGDGDSGASNGAGHGKGKGRSNN